MYLCTRKPTLHFVSNPIIGMGFAPTWLRQVSPLLHKTTLTTE